MFLNKKRTEKRRLDRKQISFDEYKNAIYQLEENYL